MTGPVTTEALVEKLARDLVREGGWNDPDAPWTENQVIIARGGAGEPVWRDFVDDARSLLGRETFTSLLAAHQQVTAERDEADRRAGAAEREAERDREDARARSAWLHQAKGQAGYSTNVSFDKVWAETLEKAARADTATSELARLRAEGEAKDRALLLLLPFVDYAAGEGLMFVETEDGEHPEMDAADIMGLAAEALGLELGSDAYLALLPAGHAAIRAARAATARRGKPMGDLPTNWLGDELRSAPSDYAMAFTRDGWNGQHSPLTGDDAALLRTKLAERYRNWTGRDLAIDLLDPNPHTPASGALKIEEADRDA